MPREQGLTEEQVEQIRDGYEEAQLSARDVLTLQFTDAIIIGDPDRLTPALREELRQQFTAPELVELGLGVGLFHALSRVLIVLGLEPEHMPMTVLPTPDVPADAS